MRKQDIEKVVSAYDGFKDIDKYARVVGVKEIADEHDYNLNVRRFVDNSPEEEKIDVAAVWKELQQLEKEREQIDKKVAGYIKELKYSK